MAITREQIIDLGFVPTKKKSPFSKRYDTLIFKLNKTDFLYLGYNQITKGIDYKRIWKSFVDKDGKRLDYLIAHLGETSFTDLRNYIERHKDAI